MNINAIFHLGSVDILHLDYSEYFNMDLHLWSKYYVLHGMNLVLCSKFL